jgi:hypothetical protein
VAPPRKQQEDTASRSSRNSLSRHAPGQRRGQSWASTPRRWTWLRRSQPGCRISCCQPHTPGGPSTIPVPVVRPPHGRNLPTEGPVARPACGRHSGALEVRSRSQSANGLQTPAAGHPTPRRGLFDARESSGCPAHLGPRGGQDSLGAQGPARRAIPPLAQPFCVRWRSLRVPVGHNGVTYGVLYARGVAARDSLLADLKPFL